MRSMQPQSGLRRGFTLLEALMAAGILLIMVVAVSSAVTAGQQHAFDAHQRIAGTLAAEELMGRLSGAEYAMLEPIVHVEPVGQLTDGQHEPFPASFSQIGRELRITNSLRTLAGVNVSGKTVQVRTFDGDDNTLALLTRFCPQPASETWTESDGEIEDGEGVVGGLLNWLFGKK